MTILCGIDFSPASDAACKVAALLAERHREPLILVHALSTVAVPPMYLNFSMLDEMRSSAEQALGELAVRMGGEEKGVSTRIVAGEPDEVVLAEAEKSGARLIVLGSVGARGVKWLLGSTADRVVSRSRVPVLAVRGEFPAAEWLEKRRPLRVAVAAELAPSSEPAIDWAAHLSEHAPCEFVVTHLSWPPEEYERLAIDAPMHLDRTHPLVAEVIRRDLAHAAQRLEEAGPARVIVESNMGSTAAAIVRVAVREQADLLVVGRGREEGRHWWDQSISRAVLRHAAMSVVCVPETAREVRLPQPKIRRLFAATDFSILGNAAVAYALSLVPNDGEAMLIHALDDEQASNEERLRLRKQLEELAASAGTNAKVSVDVVAGDDIARLISASAERFGADLICVGSRGRSGLARTLLGSVSQNLLLRSRRPVMIVPAA